MANRRRANERRMAAEIACQMAEVIPNMVIQLQHFNANQNNANNANLEVSNPPRCSFKHFNSCNPPKYNGSNRAAGLLQWYESMENTFLNSDCPDDLKVRYVAGTLQKRALTWWNNEKRTLGEAATTLAWDQLKERITREFCPRNEVKKLEYEFWKLKQESGENMVYNNRFHELSVLCPDMVTPLTRGIEKYIGGLPMLIQDVVWDLTENSKEESKDGSSSSSFKKNKRKTGNMNFVVTHAILLQQVAPTIITQPNKKPYYVQTGSTSLSDYVTCPSDKSYRAKLGNRNASKTRVQANHSNICHNPSNDQPMCLVCGDTDHYVANCFFNLISNLILRKANNLVSKEKCHAGKHQKKPSKASTFTNMTRKNRKYTEEQQDSKNNLWIVDSSCSRHMT
ncbi:hypothetical protein E3N88_02229 [Mikania micrantha]|uniref:Retrotransposon gag domain-containing protein n=1 Tax=Mikania micrantha TaxID=192012 RepID=A0A5N6Q3Q2_9ASTR|nr:hypothetical protein E3N88_02229 [Mikania micrantha]